MRKKLIAIALVLSVCAAALTACGGEEKGAADTRHSPPTTNNPTKDRHVGRRKSVWHCGLLFSHIAQTRLSFSWLMC